MKYGKKIYLSILWIVLGVVLTGCALAGKLDAFWSGMGGAFLAVGILQILRSVRYRNNSEYREKVDTSNRDERNRYIASKAWSWAGYLYVIIAALACIGLRIAGLDEYSTLVSGGMCLLIVLYWVSYMVLQRKY